MEIRVMSQVSREIEKEPQALKESIYSVLSRIQEGERISMPLCKALPDIFQGLYELRFSYEAGEYRVFYYIKVKEAVYVIHAMKKKSQKIDLKTIALLKNRIRSLR